MGAVNRGSGRRGVPEVRKGQPDVKLTRAAFDARLGERVHDPAFDAVREQIAQDLDVADPRPK